MSTYRVLFNLSYDHKYYRQGCTIELNELQAKTLLDHGALELDSLEEASPQEPITTAWNPVAA